MAHTNESLLLKSKVTNFFGLGLQVIATVFIARLTMDIGTRLIYPFIPQFAAGLGLSVVGFSWLIFLRSIVGLAGPIFGVLSDQYGRRKMMAVGLLCEGLGVLGLALSWQWWAILPMILAGLSLTAFWPPQQAYISDQVPYHKRGRALAMIEFSWAITAIAILPVAGWLIDNYGWRSPLLVLSLLSLIGALVIWRYLPPVQRHSQVNLSWPEIRAVSFRPNVLASILVALLLFVSVGAASSIWGIWLTADFGLGAAALGLIATGIGVAELGGSGLSSLFIDHIGKRNGTMLGFLLTTILLLLLPLTRQALPLAVAILIGVGIALEFTIVSVISLYSEQVPEARGTVFSLTLLGTSIGGAIGTPIAAMLWEWEGLWAVCIISAACLLAACGLVWKSLQEGLTSISSPDR